MFTKTIYLVFVDIFVKISNIYSFWREIIFYNYLINESLSNILSSKAFTPYKIHFPKRTWLRRAEAIYNPKRYDVKAFSSVFDSHFLLFHFSPASSFLIFSPPLISPPPPHRISHNIYLCKPYTWSLSLASELPSCWRKSSSSVSRSFSFSVYTWNSFQ